MVLRVVEGNIIISDALVGCVQCKTYYRNECVPEGHTYK